MSYPELVECRPATLLTVHGPLGRLDLAVEAVLTLGVATASRPPEPCPAGHRDCHILRLCVLTDLTPADFGAAMRAALAHRN